MSSRDLPRAADWFSQVRAKELDVESDARWAAWMAASEQHQRAYESCELAWEVSAGLQHRPGVRRWLGEVDRLLDFPAPRRTPSRWRLAWPAGLAASIIAAGALVYLLHERPMLSAYSTRVGEQRVVSLPDRSTVALNTDTDVRVVYSPAARRVELLRGEAVFSVVKDAQRPFEVHALHGVTTAVGTQFDVEINGGAARVEVLEGTVTVGPNEATAARARVAVAAGKGVDYTREGQVSAVQRANLARIQAWRRQRLVFDDVSLEQALREYNRYTAVPIVLGDAQLGSRHINGVFRIGDRAGFLGALEQGLNLSASVSASQTVLKARMSH